MKTPILVAEAGNCHEGNLDIALKMIKVAADCGADMVKFQAGCAEGFARTPQDAPRYRRYELGVWAYRELLEHGEACDVPVFFSVFGGEEFKEFIYGNSGTAKIAARHFNSMSLARWPLPEAAGKKIIASIPHQMLLKRVQQCLEESGTLLREATLLHCVTEYPAQNPSLARIRALQNLFPKNPIGYSDHSVGIDKCLEAWFEHGVEMIEKHFTLSHDFGPLRDHEHAATPLEFEDLAVAIKG
jgi:sialic acid synthase SpsE